MEIRPMNPDELFLDRARYFLGTEYRTKIRAAVEALPQDGLWWRPHDQSNSVGNLLVHLVGNMRQWIVGGVGGVAVTRNRSEEFTRRNGPGASALLDDLDRALDEVDEVLAGLDSGNLAEPRTIQGRDITVLEAVFHVVEHFSFHLGQIVLVAKMLAPGAVHFYEDAPDGLARPVWLDRIRPPAVK